MKYLLPAFIMFASSASALTVNYPEKACAEIVSQEYSTGGGNTAFQMLEILCKDSNGNYTGFVTSWGSVGGFFGVGRLTYPEVLNYKPYNGNTLSVTK